MIHSVQFTCVLDTNVIYPIDIRDLLFWFAHYELYTPKWSDHIFDEWKDVTVVYCLLNQNQSVNYAKIENRLSC